ncbi:MAG: DUF2442 domain-containing protein [Acidobacteriota bacterium]|jgi:hypothetical protein
MQATEPITATGIELTPKALILVLGDRRLRIPWEKCSKMLAAASEKERMKAELSPGGYGIHWPLIDEDLSVNGLLKTQD